MKRLALLLTTLVPLMLAAQEPAKTGGREVELPQNLRRRDVRAGNQEWIDGLKAGDANRIVASYSEDSVSCSPSGDCVKGRSAIANQYKEVIARLGRAIDASVRSDGLQFDHDLAYESGAAEAHFPNGVVGKGRFSTVWKHQPDGHWKIFRNMSLSPPSF